MSRLLLMPKLGLTMTEGGLAQWMIKPGQAFKQGDALFVLETEKVANEIEATEDGVLEEILVAEGETVPVGTALARWSAKTPTTAASPKPRVKLQAVVRDVTVVAAQATAPAIRAGRILATPYARKLARASNLDLARVVTARARITADDVLRALKGQ